MTAHKCVQETEIALMKQHQITTDEKLDGIKVSLEKIEHRLLGNGKPGLCDEIAEIKGERKATIFWTGLICTAVTVLVNILMKYVK
jgi:hypothetical protein